VLHLALARLGQTGAVLFVVALVVFSLQELSPVDPARRALTVGGAAELPDERDVEAKRIELGLDRPLPERFATWAMDIATLDFGESFVNKQPVVDQLADRIPASATLAAVSILLAVSLALPLGVLAALNAGTWVDSLIRVFSLFGASVPAFWLALMAMWLVAVELQLLPALGSFTLEGIILPAAVLALRALGLISRLMRATMLDT
jgi:ABC-type dipeptide/oligopeptide/nickel transport system permease component